MALRLKNEFTEDEKHHSLMTWLIWPTTGFLTSSLSGVGTHADKVVKDQVIKWASPWDYGT